MAVVVSLRVILSFVSLAFLIVALACTLIGKVDACVEVLGAEGCGTAKFPVDSWNDNGDRIQARYAIMAAEIILLAITLFLLIFRALGKITKDLLFLGVCIILDLIGAGMETWYASGNAVSAGNYKAGAVAKGGCWAAAAAFLWLDLIVHVVDIVLVAK